MYENPTVNKSGEQRGWNTHNVLHALNQYCTESNAENRHVHMSECVHWRLALVLLYDQLAMYTNERSVKV